MVEFLYKFTHIYCSYEYFPHVFIILFIYYLYENKVFKTRRKTL